MPTLNADLIDDFARQKVVLFLGSGVTSSSVTRSGARMKGWHAFLESACSKVRRSVADQVREYLAVRDYLFACEILKQELEDEWPGLLLDEFNQVADPSDLHRSIMALDQRVILTTNFDKIIENAWEARVGVATHLPKVLTRIDASAFSLFKDHRTKYLIKIHGTVDDPESLIFARSEYIRNAFGSGVYQAFIETLLLTHTFVFVGFSMEDPAVSGLMEQYALKYPKARPHYMFAPDSIADNIISFNKKERKLIVLSYDASDSHAKLPSAIEYFVVAMRARQKELLAEQRVRLQTDDFELR